MIIIEIIVEALVEAILWPVFGFETKTRDEIELKKLNRKYKSKEITINSGYFGLTKEDVGIVLELMDKDNAMVKFEKLGGAIELPLHELCIE